MSAKTNHINSDRYALYHQDGLLDTFIGLVLITAGTAVAAKMIFLSGAWIALFLPLWISARKSITMSRVPADNLPAVTPRRSAFFVLALVGIFVFGLMTGLLFLLSADAYPGLRAFLSEYLHLLIGAGLTMFFLMLAMVLSTRRLGLYALLSASVFAVAHLAGWPFFISMLVIGCVMLAAGSVLFARFIRQHPVLEK